MWSSASPVGMLQGVRLAPWPLPRPRDWQAFVNDVEPQRGPGLHESSASGAANRSPIQPPRWKRLPTGRRKPWLSLTTTDRMRSTRYAESAATFPPLGWTIGRSIGSSIGSDSLLGMRGVNGLHHVTAISGPAQENLDFYAGVLGMRLVKRSVNQDDPGTYHLFYADAEGHAGTDLTFFPWAHMAPSRDGHGLATEVSLAVPAGHAGLVGRAPDRLRRHRRADRDAVRRARAADRRPARPARRAGRDAARRRARLHAVGGQPGTGRAPDPRPARRPRRRARSRSHRRDAHAGPRLRPARHRGRLAALRDPRPGARRSPVVVRRTPLRRLRTPPRRAHRRRGRPARRVGHRQHPPPRLARRRRRARGRDAPAASPTPARTRRR